jgi:hypothetical protein
MRQGLSTSLLALVVTFGTVVGAQLGRDSIAEIKPLFFSDLPDPPAVIDGTAAAPMQFGTPGTPQEISWGYPAWNRGPVCWGCPGQPNPYEVDYVDTYVDPVDAPIPTAGKAKVHLVSADTAPSPEPSGAVRDLQRYLAYPVRQEESRRMSQTVELQRSRSGAAADDPGAESERQVDM